MVLRLYLCSNEDGKRIFLVVIFFRVSDGPVSYPDDVSFFFRISVVRSDFIRFFKSLYTKNGNREKIFVLKYSSTDIHRPKAKILENLRLRIFSKTKNEVFSVWPFLFSVWIPPQEHRQTSQHHGRIITATPATAFSWLLSQPQPPLLSPPPPLLSPPPPFLPLPQ